MKTPPEKVKKAQVTKVMSEQATSSGARAKHSGSTGTAAATTTMTRSRKKKVAPQPPAAGVAKGQGSKSAVPYMAFKVKVRQSDRVSIKEQKADTISNFQKQNLLRSIMPRTAPKHSRAMTLPRLP